MKVFRALLLIVALSVSTYAGNMPNGVADPPPPSPSSAVTATTLTEGDMHTTVNSTDLVTEITLNVLHSVLALI
jgi:hypothetical protein